MLRLRDLIVEQAPDILLLLDFDHDFEGRALQAFVDLLATAGHPMPHHLAPTPNAGQITALDLDGDGRLGGAGDAQGWGRFTGDGGMVLLSRFSLIPDTLRDHGPFLWRDLPGTRLPQDETGAPVLSDAILAVQRLASVAAWEVSVHPPNGPPLGLMAWHAGPPVFGGPHRRNWLRNAAENAFWLARLDGRLGPLPRHPYVLLGDSNLDPDRGAGDHAVMRALLGHPALQDPAPRAAEAPPGVRADATAHWPQGPGALRVDYILPSADLAVTDARLVWPSDDATHALIIVDIAWPPP